MLKNTDSFNMFKVFKEPCKNCLLSPDAIVSPDRRKEILQECAKEQKHFTCHKATMKGEDVCCRTFYDKMGHISQSIRMAERLRVVEFVDQEDTEKLPTYKEMNDN